MFKFLKFFFYAILVGGGIFLYWFLPKYSYIQKNPGYCTQLSEHLYYCGTAADMKGVFGK